MMHCDENTRKLATTTQPTTTKGPATTSHAEVRTLPPTRSTSSATALQSTIFTSETSNLITKQIGDFGGSGAVLAGVGTGAGGVRGGVRGRGSSIVGTSVEGGVAGGVGASDGERSGISAGIGGGSGVGTVVGDGTGVRTDDAGVIASAGRGSVTSGSVDEDRYIELRDGGRVAGIGVDRGVGSSVASDIEAGEGSGVLAGLGSGVGARVGSGVGREVGNGIGAGVNSGVGAGMGSGVGTGASSGSGTGEGSGVATGEGSGVGVDTLGGASAGIGISKSGGAGFASGSGSGFVTDIGTGMTNAVGTSVSSAGGVGSSVGRGYGDGSDGGAIELGVTNVTTGVGGGSGVMKVITIATDSETGFDAGTSLIRGRGLGAGIAGGGNGVGALVGVGSKFSGDSSTAVIVGDNVGCTGVENSRAFEAGDEGVKDIGSSAVVRMGSLAAVVGSGSVTAVVGRGSMAAVVGTGSVAVVAGTGSMAAVVGGGSVVAVVGMGTVAEANPVSSSGLQAYVTSDHFTESSGGRDTGLGEGVGCCRCVESNKVGVGGRGNEADVSGEKGVGKDYPSSRVFGTGVKGDGSDAGGDWRIDISRGKGVPAIGGGGKRFGLGFAGDRGVGAGVGGSSVGEDYESGRVVVVRYGSDRGFAAGDGRGGVIDNAGFSNVVGSDFDEGVVRCLEQDVRTGNCISANDICTRAGYADMKRGLEGTRIVMICNNSIIGCSNARDGDGISQKVVDGTGNGVASRAGGGIRRNGGSFIAGNVQKTSEERKGGDVLIGTGVDSINKENRVGEGGGKESSHRGDSDSIDGGADDAGSNEGSVKGDKSGGDSRDFGVNGKLNETCEIILKHNLLLYVFYYNYILKAYQRNLLV